MMGWVVRTLVVTLVLAVFLLGTAPSWAESLQYTYDDLGRLQSITYENGTQLLYSYDEVGNRTVHVIRLRGGPTPPEAADDTYDAIRDTPLTVDLPGIVGNDTDADQDTLTATLATDAANGSVILYPDGSFSYTPDQGFVGLDSFTYQADDGATSSNTATVTITVSSPPVAGADSTTTNEDMAVTVDVLANDSDPDGDPLTITAVTSPSAGTAAVDDGGTPADPADDTVVYTPHLDFTGEDTFTYTIDDSKGATDTATVTVTVDPVNDAPVASDEEFDTPFNTPLIIADPGILSNDTDVDGDNLTPAISADVSHGTLNLNVEGGFTYTPDAGFTGTDSFDYTVSDGVVASDVATTTIQVGAPGSFVSDDFSGASLSGIWSLQGPVGVGTAKLASDSQDAFLEIVVPDGGTYDAWGANNTTVRLMQAASDEDFGIEAKFLSTPSQRFEIQGILVEQDAQNWIRFDTLHDGSALRIFAAVTVDGVSSYKIYQAVAPGSASHLRVTRSGDIWAFDYSADGTTWTTAVSFTHALSVTAVGPFAGSADVAPGYTAQVDYFFNTAAPIVPEDPLPPVAVDDTVEAFADTPLVIDVSNDLLANDSDPNGETLTLTGFGQPTNGTLADNGDGTLTYTPTIGFAGSDSFTYTVSDGTASNTASVAVIVTEFTNTAPVALPDTYNTALDTPLTVVPPGVLGNDDDVDEDALTASLNTDVSNGTLVLDANGGFNYTPNTGFTGTDSFSYRANDGEAASDVATVTIQVGLPGGFVSDDFSGASLSGIWSLQGPVGTALLGTDAQDRLSRDRGP